MRCATRRIQAIFSLDEALDWIERIKPKRAILTNLHSDLDYETLRKRTAARMSSPPTTGSASSL